MNRSIITTNLRIPKSNWVQIKALASEEQMSLNEYINYIVNLVSKARQLSIDFKKIPLRPLKHDPIWDWPYLEKKFKSSPMSLSSEDELIYG